MQWQVKGLLKPGVKDAQGRRCPKDLLALLRRAGIVSIGCRKGRLNWDVIRSDAKSIIARYAGKPPAE
jgi:hypothetical protein